MKTYFVYLEYDYIPEDAAHKLRSKGFEVQKDNEGWVVVIGKGRDGERVINRIRKAVSAIAGVEPYSWGYWRI